MVLVEIVRLLVLHFQARFNQHSITVVYILEGESWVFLEHNIVA